LLACVFSRSSAIDLRRAIIAEPFALSARSAHQIRVHARAVPARIRVRPRDDGGFHSRVDHMTPAQRELLQELQEVARTAPTVQSLMEQIAHRLHEKMTRYNWVGFYLVDPADSSYLIVGPFAGSFTPNARLRLDTGLCGAAATAGQTIVVQDVSKDPRYLSGSSMVKSEIVVPIHVKKQLAGELDVESYFADSFPESEQEFVEACAHVVAAYLGRT
jgi:L-methionine (R)-S-oxide reductase